MRARASAALCEFVRRQAPPHYASSDAPSTWLALQLWHNSTASARRAGETPPIPVYDGGSDNTIYPDAETNYAFRAWHDSIHLANYLGFDYASEVRVGLIHMQQARRAGLSQTDQDMLIADTIGQITYYQAHKVYVNLQDQFVYDVMRDGLNETVARGAVY